MIRSFLCTDTQALFEGHVPRRFRGFALVAQRKLALLHAAETLGFLHVPAGYALADAAGSSRSRHRLRGDDRFQIGFIWGKTGPEHVAIEEPPSRERA